MVMEASELSEGYLFIIVFCPVLLLILKWSGDLCLDSDIYCQQQFSGDIEKIKACERKSNEEWERITGRKGENEKGFGILKKVSKW